MKNILRAMGRWIAPKFNFYVKPCQPRPSIIEMLKLKRKGIIAVEIGSYKGDNAQWIMKILNPNRLYIVDPYISYKEYKNDSANKYLDKAENEAKKKLSRYGNRIIWIKKFSSEAKNDIPMADFIYIDGNHDYEYVKRDIKNYYPKVKSGGILAGHDIEFRGVFRAVAEFVVKNKIKNYFCKNEDWVIVKK